MGSSITSQQVEHVAGLANLQVSEEELELYTKQIQDVLGYVEQLDRVNVDGIKPTYQTLDGTTNVWREDEVGESLSQEEAVGGAKRTVDGYFVTDTVFSRNEGTRKYKKVQKGIRRKIDKYNSVLTEVDSKGNLGVKDLFCTKGIETTAGSAVLSGFRPQYSATIIQKLENIGYRVKNKLNQDAWGHGSSGENSDFGPTLNPWNKEYAPGGSSSGSAAAVASGIVDYATGTDTGGSIRLPASFANLVGLKPSYGALSRYGVIAFSSSLDCPSLLARTVVDVKKLFKVAIGTDDRDATSRREVSQTSPKTSLRNMGSDEIRIGLPEEFFREGLDFSVKNALDGAIEELSKAGFEAKQISLPHLKYALAVYYLIATTETASNLGRYDGIRYGNDRSYFGAEAKRRIMLGTFASSAGYSAKFFEKAARVRTLIIQDFEQAFNGVDLILASVSPTPPFKLGEKANDPLQMYLSDILTVPVNLAGLPALALPCGLSKSGLPIGMQLIGPRWSEEKLFEVGEKYQKLTKWHKRRPFNRQIDK